MPDSPLPPAAARIGNRRASASAAKDKRKVSTNDNAADPAELLILMLRCPREQALAALESALAIPGTELARLVRRGENASRRRSPGPQALDYSAILRGSSLPRGPTTVRTAVLPTRGAPAPRRVRAYVLPLRSAAA
jgi:hypothetical protein